MPNEPETTRVGLAILAKTPPFLLLQLRWAAGIIKQLARAEAVKWNCPQGASILCSPHSHQTNRTLEERAREIEIERAGKRERERERNPWDVCFERIQRGPPISIHLPIPVLHSKNQFLTAIGYYLYNESFSGHIQ